uniref:ThiF domain-containing protein n=1 Tax=Mesocestoides corti TaxID=53468 RepID=A0A5K3F0H3_MESCO
MCTPKALSEEEAALYDRQIRLWGLEAQSKLKRAKLLLLGLSPVAGEIIKNIVLCGISTLTIADRKTVTEDDIEHCFLYEESHFGQLRNISAVKRAQALNTMVSITCESNIEADFLYKQYKDYDEFIIALDFHDGILNDWIFYANKFRSFSNQSKIHCVLSFGMHAIGFADLGCYTYESDENRVKASGDVANTDPPKSANGDSPVSFVQYPSIKELFDLTWRGEQASRLSAKRMPKGFFLARLISQVNGPITSQALQDAWYNVAEDLGVPTTLLSIEDFESCCGMSSVAINAIIGGIISQEVIQGLSHKGTPKGNWYFMDGRTCEVTVLWIPSRAQRPDSSS